jgi:hypothetical protein
MLWPTERKVDVGELTAGLRRSALTDRSQSLLVTNLLSKL